MRLRSIPTLSAALTSLIVMAGSLAAAADDRRALSQTNVGEDAFGFVREKQKTPILVFHFPRDGRPYTHPIVAPDGKGTVTEFSPGHHPHQTGLYVGFLKVNGRDYFHNRGADSYRRVEFKRPTIEGRKAKWSVVYDWLAADGSSALEETQRWTFEDFGDHYTLDLDWIGRPSQDVIFSRHEYGGLFLRMPWTAKTGGDAVNSEGESNRQAEGQKARWVDVGVPLAGRKDRVHVAIFDHPANPNHPATWRVDDQLGVGPALSRPGDWSIPAGRNMRLRYRLSFTTGELDKARVESEWKAYTAGK